VIVRLEKLYFLVPSGARGGRAASNETNQTESLNGTDTDSANGTHSSNGTDSANGTQSANGTNSTDGTDGTSPTRSLQWDYTGEVDREMFVELREELPLLVPSGA